MIVISYGFLVLAAILDITANLLLEKSDGFKHKKYGIPALILICIAFTLLAQATKVLDLSVAYLSWGSIAILGTTLSAKLFFGQSLNWKGWLGMFMVCCSLFLLNL